MTLHGIDFPADRLADFCRANGVRRLAVFGSILHPAFRQEVLREALNEYVAA